jgi:hypothetical protein
MLLVSNFFHLIALLPALPYLAGMAVSRVLIVVSRVHRMTTTTPLDGIGLRILTLVMLSRVSTGRSNAESGM